jgi:hypothetical protein
MKLDDIVTASSRRTARALTRDRGTGNGSNSDMEDDMPMSSCWLQSSAQSKCAVILSSPWLRYVALLRSGINWHATLSARLFRAPRVCCRNMSCQARQAPRELGLKPSALQDCGDGMGQCFNRPHSPQLPCLEPASTTTCWTQCRRQPMSRAFTIADQHRAKSQASEPGE